MAINEVRRRVREGNSREEKDLLHRFLQYRDDKGKGIPQRELEVEAFTPVWVIRHLSLYVFCS